MKHTFKLIVGLLFTCHLASAQKTIELDYSVYLNRQDLVLDKAYYIEQLNDTIEIDLLKFYLSGIALLSAQKDTLYTCAETQLLDLSIPETLTQNLEIEREDQVPAFLVFNLGVDSLINDGGAQGGDLDPMQGMYWSWQSGYVNFKMEGSSPLCDTRLHKFNFHLGGFLAPHESIQKVVLPIDHTDDLRVVLHIDEFVNQLQFKEMPNVMKPGTEAVNYSQLLARSFKVEN